MAVSLIGRQPKLVEAEVVRELTASDLVLLDVERGVKPTHVKKLRDSHHKAARLIAQGLPMWDVSFHTGLTASRISVLKSDPSFQELLSLYQREVGDISRAAFAENQQKLSALNSDAIEELHDRLIDEPEKFSQGDLVDIIKMSSDRTGLGPQSRSTNLNVNVGIADTISEAWDRVSRAKVIEGKEDGRVADQS